MRRYLSVVFLSLVLADGQVYHTFVTSVNSIDATAFNNSHKIATQQGEWMSDTIHLVYHSADSIYLVSSVDMGWTWQTPYYLYRGIYPAFDIDLYGMRHIAWQQLDTNSGNHDIFYDCLDDYSPPINVSQSINNSILPDLVIDSAIVAHITWTEMLDSTGAIYYRSSQGGVLGDTVRLSVTGENSHSSISIFQPNRRVYVSWFCIDSSSYTPYHIFYRYKEASWSDINELAGHWKALRYPSFDFSHQYDSLSACWEDSTSDNLEATFFGGNQGGGYATAGRSTYPVISTVGHTYSYYFWQEDSAGYEDIYCHLYYEMSGWYMEGSLRDFFMISEPIRFPNVCGAYLTWTQGNSPPYGIWFACFGYPIGIRETLDSKPILNRPGLVVSPNPFAVALSIQYVPGQGNGETLGGTRKPKRQVRIFDVSGREVKSLLLRNPVIWNGTDNKGKNAPPGLYFVDVQGCGKMVKAVKLR